jgi:membrane protein
MWSVLKDTAASWSNHKAARLGAALAYYSIFSLGPLIVIAVAVAGLTFRQDAVRGEVSAQLQDLLGPAGAQAVNAMLLGASKPTEGILATVLGVGTLVFAAVGLVVQLKDALNTVWEVEPAKASGIWHFVRTYVVSLAAVLSLGFLLLVSLLLTTALAAGGKYIAPYVPEVAMHALGSALSFGMITLLFAMMFKWLPDTYVAWRDVWPGAAVTAALFEIGKLLIGLYIGKQGLESTYGAAASLVVLLIWVYYSSQLVLIGAEFTRAYAKRRALGNISASGDPPPIAAPGVDHYVHVAAGRSVYAAAIMALLVASVELSCPYVVLQQMISIRKDRAMAARAQVRSVVSDAQDKGREAVEAVSEVRDNLANAIDKSLKKRPYTTLGLTLALGFLLGVVWAR